MTLHMIQMAPDMPRLMAWAAAERLLPGRGEADLGYVLHAALHAGFGEAAPKPFALEVRGSGARLLGYAALGADALHEAADTALPVVHAALRIDTLAVKPMPERFAAGRRLGFTVRVRPTIRRDRDGDRNRAVECDVFPRADPAEGDGRSAAGRGTAYAAWLRERLVAGGAQPLRLALDSYRSLAVLRRDGGRRLCGIVGPDATLSGLLAVADPDAFAGLLARGVGRHRAFGFGMLLLRPA